MKEKILSLAIMLMLSVASFAQLEVTKFMGIPIDGSKQTMIQKLEAKGFKYNRAIDVLTGEFNGEQVTLAVQTNNNKVWRIGVLDNTSRSASDIIARYNQLLHQFKMNIRYEPAPDKAKEIPQNENLSYEMNVNNKSYEAIFCQRIDMSKIDTVALKKHIKESFKETYLSFNKEDQAYWDKMTGKIPEDKLMSMALQSYILKLQSNRTVWFTISQSLGLYKVIIFYENGNNRAHGEDL